MNQALLDESPRLTIAEQHLTRETRSPFLPGTDIQFAWDSTSLGYLKTCPRLYQYIMIDGWGSQDESVHLRFGSEYHIALEQYDHHRAEGLDHEEALRATVAGILIRTTDFRPDPETKAGKYKNRDSLLRLVIDYIDKYEEDPAKTYIKADGSPAVELSFSFELEWGPVAQPVLELVDNPRINESFVTFAKGQPYLLCGHLDRVVEYMDSLFVMDRKTTTTTLSSYYFAQFDPNNQMSLYSLAGQVVLDSPIKGVIIDGAQILIDASRFVRHITYRTNDQQEEWLKDLKYWLALAESYATEGYWPMNDTACDKFGGCRFREVCSKSPHVRDRFLESRFTKLEVNNRWNPLRPR
jgi:hypothetical protein